MPIYSFVRLPQLPAGQLTAGSVSDRKRAIELLLERKWSYAKVLLQPWLVSRKATIDEDTRQLQMEPEICAEIESKLGLYLALADTQLQEPSPSPPIQAKLRRSRVWHWREIGLKEPRPKGLATGKNVTIALCDTGIDKSHLEFKGKDIETVVLNDDGTVKRGGNRDENGHGTAVASIIAGKTIGIAPDARLISAQVLDETGTAKLGRLFGAIEWLTYQPKIDIVVLCFGMVSTKQSHRDWQLLISQLLEMNILPIIAVGNYGPGNPTCPGNTYGGISVGWTTRESTVSPISGSGRVKSDDRRSFNVPNLVAPGVEVYTASPGGNYNYISGATPATAIVAGVAALVRERYPTWTAQKVRERILATCRTLQSKGIRQGSGLVQIEAAL